MQTTHGFGLAERWLLLRVRRGSSVQVAPRVRVDRRPRISLGVSSAGCTFLSVYMLLHAQHVAHADFVLVSSLSTIPLFATLLASSAPAIIVGASAAAFAAHPAPLLARMPTLISLLSLLFALEVLAFP